VNHKVERLQVALILVLLAVLHFTVRPWLPERVRPDLLLLALLIFSLRAQPGRAAVAGFLIGLLSDSVTNTTEAFGAAMLAYSVVGYLAAWGKAVFFADNPAVAGGLFFAGVLVRDALVLLWGGHAAGTSAIWQLTLWTPLVALSTAVSGIVVLLMFPQRLRVRVRE
jgi:rod shape-determining protein MreD